jgi:cytochrome b561
MESGMDAIASSPRSYDPVMRAVHWSTVALIAAMFATAWTAHSGLAGDYYASTMQLHRSLGLTVLALTIFRLAWRSRAFIPALPSDLPAIQKLAARATEVLLYALLIAQPLLGLLQTNARGQIVDLFFIASLPPVIGPDKALARQLHDLHAFAATVLLGLIGIHAAAALFHHFIRRDDVLNAILPARLRRS